MKKLIKLFVLLLTLTQFSTGHAIELSFFHISELTTNGPNSNLMYSSITTQCSGGGCFTKKEKAFAIQEQINNFYITSEIAPELRKEIDGLRSTGKIPVELTNEELIEMMDVAVYEALLDA